MARSMEQLLLTSVVFLVSAVVMVLEITAGRLIAPYVGVSLYSWTAIIGVVLAGLSLGSWLGGVAADRNAGPKTVAVCLLAGAVSCVLVLLLLTWLPLLVADHDLSLMAASTCYAFGLFFLPAVLLGILPPLLTALALRSTQRQGRILGRMHAVSALGGIIGTFAAGFWLVQTLGSRHVLLALSATLVLLALPFLTLRRSGAAGVAVALVALTGVTVVGLVASARNGLASPCLSESEYYCIRVEDASREAPFGEARAMVLDHLLHGINHRDEPGMLIAPYVHLVDELAIGYLGEASARARYLFLGGGAYTHPRAVSALAPEADVTVIEIDPQVSQTARDHLYLAPDRMHIVHSDARVAVRSLNDDSFDVLVGDVFHDVAIPFHLLTVEFFRAARRVLAPQGVFLLNVVDAHPEPRLVASVVHTLREVFDHVHVWLEQDTPRAGRQTYVLSATDAFAAPATITAQRGFERQWAQVTEELMSRAGLAKLVLTDDYAPIESLISNLLLGNAGR